MKKLIQRTQSLSVSESKAPAFAEKEKEKKERKKTKKPIELDSNGLIHLMNTLPKGEALIITAETAVPLRKKSANGHENPWIGDTIIKQSRLATTAKPDFGEELKRARASRGLGERE